MSLGLLFLAGTFATWAGWFFAFRTLYLGLSLLMDGSLDRIRYVRKAGWSALLGAIGILIGLALPRLGELKSGPDLYLPLVWVVMPYSGWLALISVLFLLGRLVQVWLGLNREERLDRAKAAGMWSIGAAIFLWLYYRDPANKTEILKGGIPLSFSTIAVLSLALFASMAAMVLAAKAAHSRGLAKSAVNQLALVAGSILFGLPFAFLVITSFKEDRDMSSANGIVWIPKVQESIPYMDPRNPLYETQFDGQTVRGLVSERLSNHRVKIDVLTPLAIRGTTVETTDDKMRQVPKQAPIFSGAYEGKAFRGFVVEDLENGGKKLRFLSPQELKDQEATFDMGQIEPVRHPGLLWQNYPDALSYMPPETNMGLVYLKNTLILVILSVIGTLLSSSIVAYAFSRMSFPGRELLFAVLLSTMMLPSAVTLLPQFLIFRQLGWIDTMYPLWVPAFFASAFNVFLLRQFFKGIPMELEDAAKIDGCSYLRAFWNIMLPQIKPALAVIAIWTFMGAWNNFMGPLIYVNSPENMPLSYALQLFQGDRSNEPGLLMAFATMAILPVLAVFFFAQKYFIEGVTLSGLGGR